MAVNEPPKPKLSIYDVLAMFEQFGFTFEQVNGALAGAEDKGGAFNIFEGLKIQLTARWENMQNDLPPERLEGLHIVYERLQKLKLYSYKPPQKPKYNPTPTGDPLVDAMLRGDKDALDYVRDEAKRNRANRIKNDPKTLH